MGSLEDFAADGEDVVCCRRGERGAEQLCSVAFMISWSGLA